jgi:hypothetical protein
MKKKEEERRKKERKKKQSNATDEIRKMNVFIFTDHAISQYSSFCRPLNLVAAAANNNRNPYYSSTVLVVGYQMGRHALWSFHRQWSCSTTNYTLLVDRSNCTSLVQTRLSVIIRSNFL